MSSKLKIKSVAVGPIAVNCYLVWNTGSNHGYIIDPGDEPTKITRAVSAAKFTPKAILLTHAHVDHIRAVGAIATKYKIPVFLNASDKVLYYSPDNALLPWLPAAENLPPIADDFVDFASEEVKDIEVQVIHTPGHTPGGVCYYFHSAGFILTGDTLFKGSCGRTDLPGGDEDDLRQSIRYSLMTLPDETIVYPGHHDETTIGAEKRLYIAI